jgi:hypothetical protein
MENQSQEEGSEDDDDDDDIPPGTLPEPCQRELQTAAL